MAKANKKAIQTGNFWDITWMHGAYAGTPVIDADETKARHKIKKDRLRNERQTINKWRAIPCPANQHRNKQQKTHDQIQYGFDLVNWWNEQHG